MNNRNLSIIVGVATFSRPEGLRKLLASLQLLEFRKCKPPELRIIIVDNDVNESARAVYNEFRDKLWKLSYLVEPKRGISFARNAVLGFISDETNFIVFIDDDEEAEPQWLDELIAVQTNLKAEIVAGPVLSKFAELPPEWILKGKFFDRHRHLTGTTVKYVGAGNLLISAKVLKKLTFDERLALTGGEDTLFSMQATKAGYKMVWADNAVAYETIPPIRVSEQWLLQRAYRMGNTMSTCERLMGKSVSVTLTRLVKAFGNITLGSIKLLISFFKLKHYKVSAKQAIWRGRGMLAGIFGHHYQEYGENNGSHN